MVKLNELKEQSELAASEKAEKASLNAKTEDDHYAAANLHMNAAKNTKDPMKKKHHEAMDLWHNDYAASNF